MERKQEKEKKDDSLSSLGITHNAPARLSSRMGAGRRPERTETAPALAQREATVAFYEARLATFGARRASRRVATRSLGFGPSLTVLVLVLRMHGVCRTCMGRRSTPYGSSEWLA